MSELPASSIAAQDDEQEGVDIGSGLAVEADKETIKAGELTFCYKNKDICPGGKKVGECHLGWTMLMQVQVRSGEKDRPGFKDITRTLEPLELTCKRCGSSAVATIIENDGQPELNRDRIRGVEIAFYPDGSVQPSIHDLGHIPDKDKKVGFKLIHVSINAPDPIS